MRTISLALTTCLFLGCASRPQVADTGDGESETESETETEAETEAETETGDPYEPHWVYSSDLHPRSLVATADGVVVGGAYLSPGPDPDFADREADVIALDASGELAWNAAWLSEDDLPESVAALATDADGIWVGFEGESCGDWCYESRVSYLDHDGVELWRLDPPLIADIRQVYAIDGDVIVVAENWSPTSSHLIRLDSDGVEQWRWDSNPDGVAPPYVSDVELVFDSLWGLGARLNENNFEAPWIGRFDLATGALIGVVGAGLDPAGGGGGEIELLGDGVVVTTANKLSALEVDGVQSWQVTIPGDRCSIVHKNDRVMIGCEAELQLRDVQGSLITKWQDLEATTQDYVWQDVALGERAYAGIGSAFRYVEGPGKVHGIELE